MPSTIQSLSATWTEDSPLLGFVGPKVQGESRQALELNHPGLPAMALLTSNENETNTHSGESVPEEHTLGEILIPLPGAGLRRRN